MENEIKIKHVEPEDFIHDFPGLGRIEWISREEYKSKFPDQPERSKREDHCPNCNDILKLFDGSNLCQSCGWKGWVFKGKINLDLDNGCGALNIVETQ